MPGQLPQHDIDAAEAAIAYASQVRHYHRRRTERDNKQRGDDINLALARLKESMGPIRRHIGQFPYGPQTDIASANRQIIRETSANIQNERRKLHKMKLKENNLVIEEAV